jgi:hypothetical protein
MAGLSVTGTAGDKLVNAGHKEGGIQNGTL